MTAAQGADLLTALATAARNDGMLQSLSPRLCMWARSQEDGRVVGLSDGFAELSGVPIDELLGNDERWLALVHPDDRPMMAAAAEDLVDQSLVWRLCRPDGQIRWVRSRVVGTPVDIEPPVWLGVVEDVTDELLVLAQHELVNETFADVSLALNDATAEDLDEALDHGLARLGRLVGADRAYLFRIHDADRLSNTHEWCAAGVEPAIDMLQDMAVAEFDWVLPRMVADGPQVISVEDLPREAAAERASLEAQGINSLVLVPVLVRGELVGLVGFDSVRAARDWTESDVGILRRFADLAQSAISRAEAMRETEQLIEALVAARVAAEEASAAKSRFLSRASHELRTPLSGVIGFAELLSYSELGDNQRAQVDHIVAAARHQLGLIDDLLEIGRVESGDAGVVAEPFDLAELVLTVVALAGHTAEATGVELRHTVRGPLPVVSDRNLVQRVLTNLTTNAVKYNRPGGWVELDVAASPGELVLRVADSGIGIAPEDVERLWTPFERLGAERTSVPGTGLGLAIVANVVDALGGAIDVDSGPTGTTFTVTLPHAAGERAAGGAPSIVLVDDDPTWLAVLDEALRSVGGFDDLRTAATGEEAVAAVRHRRPDLVVLDRHLPDTTGEELIGRLRAGAAGEVPVLMVSADATADARARCLAAGADDYLTKPPSIPDLVATVQQLLVRANVS